MTLAKKLLVAAGFVVAGLAAGQNTSYAQPCDPLNPPVGQPYTCIIVDGQKVIVDAYGNPTAGQSEGDAQFITNKGGQVPCQTTQTPQTFNVSVTTSFGTVTTQLDPSRPSPVSTIVANQAAQALPATGKIGVYLTATNSSRPGVTYKSEGLVTFTNTNVRSFPFNGEPFVLSGRVKFINERDPRDFFTLSETRVVLTSRKGN